MKRPGENWGKINYLSIVRIHGHQGTNAPIRTEWARPITLRYTLIVTMMSMRRWSRNRTKDI
jgi:hypothetical protein